MITKGLAELVWLVIEQWEWRGCEKLCFSPANKNNAVTSVLQFIYILENKMQIRISAIKNFYQ